MTFSRRNFHPNAHAARRPGRRGFSFVEILFAVMILGIGFIMIAGVFPVAISQTQSNAEESRGAAIARGGVAYVEKLSYTSQLALGRNDNGRVQLFDEVKVNVPGPMKDGSGIPIPIQVAGREMIKGNQILTEDPRYAWVPLWRRPNNAFGQPENYAQVIVIAVQVRNHGAYTPADTNAPDGPLVPKTVSVSFSGSEVTVSGPNVGRVARWAYLVMEGDSNGNGAGWVLRVGPNKNDDGTGTTYLLEPGSDLSGPGTKPGSGNAWVIGRGNTVGVSGALILAQFSGGVQDIAAYTTYIQLK